MKLDQIKDVLKEYEKWLIDWEYSPATIEKYTRTLTRFFQESGADQVPSKESVVTWRDGLMVRGYSVASINAMLAAVNGYQEFCGNLHCKAKPLRVQRRSFCDAERELTREEYFRLLEAARAAGNRRTLLLLQTLCAGCLSSRQLPLRRCGAGRR